MKVDIEVLKELAKTSSTYFDLYCKVIKVTQDDRHDFNSMMALARDLFLDRNTK